MIRTEKEYKALLQKLRQNEEAVQKQREHLASMNLSKDQIELAMSPILSFYHQLEDEIKAYERVKNRDWEFIYQLANFQNIGQLFIALRIAYGLTQKDLGIILGVTEAQVSKDERNEYHGISLEKAMKVMKALGIALPHLEVNKNLNRNSLLYQ